MSKIDNPPTVVTDHGALTGLTDDDHTQYPLLAGRSGGQTLIGGTGTTDDLILRSTSGVGAAGADMIFQVGNNGATEAMRILNSGFVGIGTASPTFPLYVARTSSGYDTALFKGFDSTHGGDILAENNLGNRAVMGIAGSAQSAGVGGINGAGYFGTVSAIPLNLVTKNTARVTIDTSGNVGIGTTTPGGGTTAGGAVLSLTNSTAPVGGVANQVSLYSADVAASAELFALDEAGNTPQLSPHPTDLLNSLPISATGPYAYPCAYSASNAYLGKKIQVDLAGLVAAVEQVTGKQFAFVTDLPPAERADWDTGQEAQRVRRQAEIDKANQRRVDLDVQIAAEPDADKKAELIKQRDAIMPPVRYVKKRPPKWMRDRGVTTTIREAS